MALSHLLSPCPIAHWPNALSYLLLPQAIITKNKDYCQNKKTKTETQLTQNCSVLIHRGIVMNKTLCTNIKVKWNITRNKVKLMEMKQTESWLTLFLKLPIISMKIRPS